MRNKSDSKKIESIGHRFNKKKNYPKQGGGGGEFIN